MLSRPGLSRSEPRASAQVANVAAGVGRPRPGGSGYRPGRSPPSTHQASGSAKSPRLAYWRETEALEGGDPPEPQNPLMRVGLELRAQPQVTHRPPAQHRRRIRGALFPTKVSPYSPSSLSPSPSPPARAEPNKTSHRIGRFKGELLHSLQNPVKVLNQVFGLAPSLPLEVGHFGFYHPSMRVCSPFVVLRLLPGVCT